VLRRSKSPVTAALVAAIAAALPLTVPGPATAATPCRAIPLAGATELRQTVLVAGAYASAGAIDVQLTCGVVQNGVTVDKRGEKLTGPVAVVASVVNVPVGSITSCYELRVVYLERPTDVYDNCP
jgi:hypothetical protein